MNGQELWDSHDDVFYSSFRIFNDFSIFGLPHGSQLLERPNTIEVIRIWKEVESAYTKEHIKRNQKKDNGKK